MRGTITDDRTHSAVDNTEDALQKELETFEPDPLTLERVTEIHDIADELESVAREGQLGFQILMMHPTGHVQLARDIRNFVEFWLECNRENKEV